MNSKWKLAVAIAALDLGACATFDQTYHFQSTGKSGSTNFFRVTVSGEAQTAKARYLAGFYDERAVDLYFNELKPAQGSEDQIRNVFVDGAKPPGESEALKPLTPDKAHGTFLMIFSTNPKAVADTIGAFADSQVVADALTNLTNRNEIVAARALAADQGVSDQAADAIADELKELIPAAADTPPAAAALNTTYFRALEAIIRALGTSLSISSYDDARQWLGRK